MRIPVISARYSSRSRPPVPGEGGHLSERSDAGVLDLSHNGLEESTFSLPHRFALEVNLVRVMHEPIEDDIGEGGIADHAVPVFNG